MTRKTSTDYPTHAMEVWSYWMSHKEELGWPAQSSEVRALWASQTASVAPGRDDTVRQGVGIPQCKETPRRQGSQVPRIDQASLGPHVNRLLLDMDERGAVKMADVLRYAFLFPRIPTHELAQKLSLSPRSFFRFKRRGLSRLAEALALTKKAS